MITNFELVECSICFLSALPERSISVGIEFSLNKDVILIAIDFISSLTYKIETRFFCSVNDDFWFSNANIIRSTPPATPVAPRSSLPKTDGRLSYLPPPTKAPISKVLSNASKTIPE